MSYRAEYLKIHEAAYRRLQERGERSWSDATDLELRMRLYLAQFAEHGLAPPARVLILGCGDGETAIALALRGFDVTGWDVSPSAIAWAGEKAASRGAKLELAVRNVAETAAPSGLGFDAIIDDHCLHCIVGGDRARAFARVRAELRAGGIFILRTHCGDPPAGTSPELLAMWDPESRCQVHEGVAGRYFGEPRSLIAEVERASLRLLSSRVFQEGNDWGMIEATFAG